MRRRPSLRAKSSSIEGMEPVGSSSVMRSTRVMGKKRVGTPTRSPSGSFELTDEMIEGIQVDATHGDSAVLTTSSSPQIFSLGLCKLTTTMECGSMIDPICSLSAY